MRALHAETENYVHFMQKKRQIWKQVSSQRKILKTRQSKEAINATIIENCSFCLTSVWR